MALLAGNIRVCSSLFSTLKDFVQRRDVCHHAFPARSSSDKNVARPFVRVKFVAAKMGDICDAADEDGGVAVDLDSREIGHVHRIVRELARRDER